MPSNSNTMQSRIERLRKNFVAELPQRVAAIDGAWRDWQAAPAEAVPTEQLLRHVHTLAGTAGNFGFPEITRLCRELEQTLRQQSLTDVDTQKRVETLVNELLQESAAAETAN